MGKSQHCLVNYVISCLSDIVYFSPLKLFCLLVFYSSCFFLSNPSILFTHILIRAFLFVMLRRKIKTFQVEFKFTNISCQNKHETIAKRILLEEKVSLTKRIISSNVFGLIFIFLKNLKSLWIHCVWKYFFIVPLLWMKIKKCKKLSTQRKNEQKISKCCYFLSHDNI